MKTESWLQCIIPSCGKKYPITDQRTTCDCGELLDVRYKGDFPKSLQETFYERQSHRQSEKHNIFNESGVWRFRELLNFAGVNTEDYEDCSKKLVSLDGAEGRTKPFHVTRVADYVGGFAVTAGLGIEEHLTTFQRNHDDYNDIMLKAVADRLAEAFAERMHERVRKEFWGYADDETLSNEQLIKERYQGIRPAPGYPACPDHTEKQGLFSLLEANERASITLTESCAMMPASHSSLSCRLSSWIG